MAFQKDKLGKVEYYIIKVVLILTTVIMGVAFLAFAIIHAWKFLRAAMMT